MTRILASVLVLLGLLALPACTPDPTAASPADGSMVVPVGERAGRSPVAVLQQWDRQRARAWAAGDAEGLRALYVRGSLAGERDVAMLGRWLDRGLSVDTLEVQVLRGRVVARAPRRLTVAVSERLAHATASAGSRRWSLPAGAVAERRVTLWRTGGTWRVARVSVEGGQA
ncbi:hypothetical protein NPS01_08320 [Nocardioides psychrotolerans]|uniref:SnoaL-like domain-containing protein n=1 Tax=Nocardioides psychrotolerans TaxID=1005945 RepID=A0A1I3FJN7_9ACTN|nr:hypothetical protein [Nocardioides psychrotolerans]GEP37169.1 hypothetical protein NPS01_08320 [Nocardioides psychrotolerans]SFI11342.1 hypothetical protein SAMN05216561_10512 [Nocardioides psychrotolerans]